MRAWLATLTAFACVTFGGCKSSCEALAEEICACRPNRAEEDACVQRIKTTNPPILTQADLDRCEALLDVCTCEAIEDGDLSACGLAKEGAK